MSELRAGFRGTLLQPDEEGYDETRRVWNGAPSTGRPGVVARCAGAGDVAAAVRFAREHDVEVSITFSGTPDRSKRHTERRPATAYRR